MHAKQIRCPWALHHPLETLYHDQEWGVPLHDDNKLFEFLILEGAQAGLSWLTVLKKREEYRKAFQGFDPAKVARFNAGKIESLINNPGLIRNRRKLESAEANARAFLLIQEEFGSFSNYIWRFVDHKPVQNAWSKIEQVPAQTAQSQAMSKELKKRGFNFVGPTICYAFMQATGMVNDHLTSCFRHGQVHAKG
jgi:DNA-3-methyladenine glycosylase I